MGPTEQKKTKSLVLSIDTPSKGPFGFPLITGTTEAPATIQGTVNFASNYDCKGDDITIHYTALAQVKWSSKSVSSSCHDYPLYLVLLSFLPLLLTPPFRSLVQ